MSKIKGLYPILDDTYFKRNEFIKAAKVFRNMVSIIQLRIKRLNDREFFFFLYELKKIFEHTKTKFIINDRFDIALLVGADGVHMGQDDIPPESIKKKFPELIIGYSTHSIKDLQDIALKSVDYVGFGPIFASDTKKTSLQPKGTLRLQQIIQNSPVPVCAIGGINSPERVIQTLKTGVDLVAFSYLTRLMYDDSMIFRKVLEYEKNLNYIRA